VLPTVGNDLGRPLTRKRPLEFRHRQEDGDEELLLNLEHPEGKSKAACFQSLRYTRSQWRRLANDLLEIARATTDYSIESTAFGVKYIVRGALGLDGERRGLVLTVWIVEGDKPPRLVTAYPDEE